MKLLTKTKEYEVAIVGISSFDNSLRFELMDVEVDEAFSVFLDKTETSVIKRVWEDGTENEYFGFTKFVSINQLPDGHVVVALGKG